MIHLLRSEWIKFRSVRSTVVVLALAGVLVVLIAVLTANHLNSDTSTIHCEQTSQSTPAPGSATTVPDPGNACGPGFEVVVGNQTTHLTDITLGVLFATLLFGVLGVQVIGQEYRFNTIRPTFTAAPHRYRVMAAKIIVVSAACAAIAAAMLAVCWLVGSVMLDGFVLDGTDRRVMWATVLFAALWSAAGVGIGAIVRQPIAGILIMVAESLIIEGLVGNIWKGTQKWLPFNNGIQMTVRPDQGSTTHLQSLLGGGLYFAAFCAGLVIIGAILVNRRDA
ncbi:hypothetical protein [Aquihabitans sp. McL0605]|uniref:hypothetical protein n=1 Tax=Aquihabitans sp. McL0605 TaxID=3415671 RepID=UPI003CEE5468